MNTSNLINWFIIYAYTINCAPFIKESIQVSDTSGMNRVNLIQGKSMRFKKGEQRGMDCGSNSNVMLPYKYYYMVPIIHSNVLSNPISVKYMTFMSRTLSHNLCRPFLRDFSHIPFQAEIS